jgi:hypothetical protein
MMKRPAIAAAIAKKITIGRYWSRNAFMGAAQRSLSGGVRVRF